MINEFNGIERRLDELMERLARLEPLKTKDRSAFDEDPYLRDIVERNLEVAIQCIIDICHRLISIENFQKPTNYYQSILIMGEMGVLPIEFSKHLAPIAGFRNILIHEYIQIDWDYVIFYLQNLHDFELFAEKIRLWLNAKQ